MSGEQQRGIAIVTGGSRGIGAACCRLLAAKGHLVVVNYASNAAVVRTILALVIPDQYTAGGCNIRSLHLRLTAFIYSTNAMSRFE